MDTVGHSSLSLPQCPLLYSSQVGCVTHLSRNLIDAGPFIVPEILENVVSHPRHRSTKWFQYYHIYRHMNTGISSQFIWILSFKSGHF
jgi:hypothetical protein